MRTNPRHPKPISGARHSSRGRGEDLSSSAEKADLWRRITIGEQLARNARQTPDVVAFKFEGQERRYSELEERVTALANGLITRGLGRGDRVAVMMNNCLELPESYLGICRAGGICVPINFRLKTAEVEYILQCGAAFVIADEFSLPVVAQCEAVRSGTCGVIALGVPAGGGTANYEQLIETSPTEPAGIDVTENEPAFIMYTSGTTGRPKGAVLSHLNLFVNTMNMIAALEISATDRRWLAGLPLFHIGGLNGILPFLYLGGTSIVLPTGGFDAAHVTSLLEHERITSCFFVPSQWQAICEVAQISDMNLCLERATWGASVCPPSISDAIHRTFPKARTYNVFGQTEMSSITCAMRADRFPEKHGSVGTPVPGVEVRIVDEQMRDVPAGETGEIIYRGPTVMQRYWQSPEATAAAFQGGWFHSGDLVCADADGFLYVVDRRSDMIISGGENIYCAEVEAAIDSHPAVREVAIVGAPHEKWVETPIAFIVLRRGAEATESEIIGWCKDRLASYKKPTQVRFVPELPRNASGKVLKIELRKLVGN